MPGRLFVVATPIGNLEDLSARARRVLAEVDRVLAEDTRRTGSLLSHLGIRVPMLSFHEHNESERLAGLVADLVAGARLALVSDAGTPAISDPGERLVRAAREAGIDVESVAGPSALASALAASGLPSVPSVFLGFLPARSGERKRFLESWKDTPATLVAYETPHRAAAALADAAEVLGAARRAILLRELTKLHEEGIDGTLGSLAAELARRGEIRGEIVLVIAPPEPARGADFETRFSELLAGGLPKGDAMRRAAKETGTPRAEAYRRVHGLGGEDA